MTQARGNRKKNLSKLAFRSGRNCTQMALQHFNSDGFTLGSNTENDDGELHVAWQWKANGGTTASNTDGSINFYSSSQSRCRI
jgi:hypothetical protein